ncbi:MobH family relaxase [Pseudomonas oryzihabitans]|jgi:integrating conjugative element relaxase (TIGR03760 family)|uniref:MobH family relaxase n=1 Tax=Pseudomonas oryzihabitans TaxID=47885 RepID=UPI0021DAA49B|nr:MobH family relaxase [Pseudomonas oryzihabitans]MDK8263620.1 MobH family relaxase [Pseudomonas oryzihabitans]
MFDLFFRKKAPPSAPAGSSKQGFTQPSAGQDILVLPRRQKLIENIWQRTSLSREQFASLYRDPLGRYADLVQQLPASENHHHAYPEGLLDHGLEIVAYALKIRQNYLLPIGAPPESQAAQAEAWSAAVAYGALLHDLGKIAVDIEVVLEDGKPWHPWHGRIEQPYRFRYVKGRDYQLHGAASALVYFQVLPPHVLDWLSGYRELWSSLIFVLAGQYQHAGVLGEIIVQADQASVAQELGANPQRAMEAPKNTIQRQLANGLRTPVIEKFKLNQPEGPSDGWLTQDALWLVSKPASDQLRALMLSQGVEGMPTSNAPFFNLIQDQAIIQVNAQDKAIWKATIDTGHGWKNTFTLLKVSPALIWPDPADRPAPFTGTFTLEQPEDTELDQQRPAPVSDIATPPFPIPQSVIHVTSSQEVPSSETLPPPAFQTGLDPMDETLALADELFGEAASSSEIPTSQLLPDFTRNSFTDCIAEHSAEEAISAKDTADLGQAFIAWAAGRAFTHACDQRRQSTDSHSGWHCVSRQPRIIQALCLGASSPTEGSQGERD